VGHARCPAKEILRAAFGTGKVASLGSRGGRRRAVYSPGGLREFSAPKSAPNLRDLLAQSIIVRTEKGLDMAQGMRGENRENQAQLVSTSIEAITTRYEMAGNASSSLFAPCVTHAAPTDTQIGLRVCNGCGSPILPKAAMAKAVQRPLPGRGPTSSGSR